MQHIKSANRESLLLTITLPTTDRTRSPFHAAMLSFPRGAAQQVVAQLHSKGTLQLILNGLDQSPDKLREASEQMAGRGCPEVEIVPVEMVGYYHLQTSRGEASSEKEVDHEN